MPDAPAATTAAAAAAAADLAPSNGAAPRSCGELFRVFQRLALQGFGGVVPVAHRELVERQHWLSDDEFVELLAMGQVLPGPNIINMAIIFGDRHFGWRGSAAACAGMLTLPLLIVLGLAWLYRVFASQPMVAAALRGMGAVAAGLVIATAWKVSGSLKKNIVGWPLAAALAATTLLMVGVLRWPMVWVVLSLGGLGLIVAWRRLAAMQEVA